MSKWDELELKRKARLLLGIPDDVINSDADRTLQCAIDMGYVRPEDVAGMAKRMLVLSRSMAVKSAQNG